AGGKVKANWGRGLKNFSRATCEACLERLYCPVRGVGTVRSAGPRLPHNQTSPNLCKIEDIDAAEDCARLLQAWRCSFHSQPGPGPAGLLRAVSATGSRVRQARSGDGPRGPASRSVPDRLV